MSQRKTCFTIVVLEIWPNLTHFFKILRIFENFRKMFFPIFQKFSLYYVILSIKNSKLTKKSKKNFQKIFRNFQNFSKSFAYRPTKTLRKFLKKFSKNRPFLENDAFDENGNYAISYFNSTFMSQRENLLTIVVLEIWPNLTHFFKNSPGFLKIFEKIFSDFSKIFSFIMSFCINKKFKIDQKIEKKIFKNFSKFSKFF